MTTGRDKVRAKLVRKESHDSVDTALDDFLSISDEDIQPSGVTETTVDSAATTSDELTEDSDHVVQKEVEENSKDLEAEEFVGITVDPVAEMVEAFRVFIAEHISVKQLKLTIEAGEKVDDYFIYQGQRHNVWVWIRGTRGCRFERKSILRIILNMTDDQVLKKYFKNYSLITGEENV